MMLGILIHESMWYVTRLNYPVDPSISYIFDILTYLIHSFRMQLFFILSGFFTSLK